MGSRVRWRRRRERPWQLQEAERLYRRAADLGDPGGMSSLGALLEQRGEREEAEQFYRRAAGLGDPGGMSSLGALLERRGERGEREEAEQFYRRAADLDHARGMSSRGALLERRGAEGCESWGLPEVEGFVGKWEEMTNKEGAAVLAAVRKRAEDWRTGTAGVLSLITAMLVVTDVKDSVRIFDQDRRA